MKTISFYSTDQEVLSQLDNCDHLKKSVENYWNDKGHPLPDFLINSKIPRAISTRHVATARNEDMRFIAKANKLGLQPTWAEYLSDMFVTVSRVKTSLVYPKDKDGKRVKLVPNAGLFEKKRMSEIRLASGQLMIDLHHAEWEKLRKFNANIERHDMSQWLQNFGTATDYYVADISLFLAHGVLFKDYHGPSGFSQSTSGSYLTSQVFEPAFRKVVEIFGAKPLIHQFSYKEHDEYSPFINEQMLVV
ncbi:MAG: hypothetical protein ACJAV6_000523 [Candidatus Paceibacteria bacterium]|jgi:hypothetical protein